MKPQNLSFATTESATNLLSVCFWKKSGRSKPLRKSLCDARTYLLKMKTPTTTKILLISIILLNCMITAHAADKENRHLTQVSFDEYLVQMNWVQDGVVPATTSSMTIIDKKSHGVIQTIPLEGDSDNLWIDSGVVANGNYLKMKDLDEDGHKDLWLLTNWGTGVHDHSVYRFNPKTETFADRYKHNENDYGKGEWKTTVKKIDPKNDLYPPKLRRKRSGILLKLALTSILYR